MYLRDDGRTRHGKLVTPDQPAAAPPAPASSPVVSSATSPPAAVQTSAPGEVTNEALPIAPLHLWRDFSGPLIHKPVNVSGTPFPWPPRSEGVTSSWRQFVSSPTAETRMGNANGDDAQERDGGDDDKDEEMSDGDNEGDDVEEAQGRTAGDDNASKK